MKVTPNYQNVLKKDGRQIGEVVGLSSQELPPPLGMARENQVISKGVWHMFKSLKAPLIPIAAQLV